MDTQMTGMALRNAGVCYYRGFGTRPFDDGTDAELDFVARNRPGYLCQRRSRALNPH